MVRNKDLGQRLLITLIDEYANTERSSVWGVIASDERDLSKGFKNITYGNFANAINLASRWLQDHLPPQTCDFDTIAYVGPKDVRYPIIAVAAAKLKKKLLLPSPLASTSAQAHLIEASQCQVYLHGGPLSTDIPEVLSARSTIRFMQIPAASDLLWRSAASEFPYNMTWDQAKDHPWLIFHTSGTTGIPKLVTYTHSMMSSLDAAELMPDAWEETMNRHFEHRRWYTPLPSLHFVGMTVSLQFPVFLRSVVVIGPVTPGPTHPRIAKEVLKYSKAQGALLPPALIDGLCEDAEGLRCLRNLDYVYFAGAPLTQRSAEKLIDYVAVKPAMGSTEAGAYFIRTIDQDDWQYYNFLPAMGMELQHAADNMYEAVFVRSPEVEKWQQVFQVYPELDEFRTKDLFAKHPTKDDLWKYVGRTDDMVPFSHGENLYVADIEAEIISSHPAISALQIGGQGRPKPFLLIEWKYHLAPYQQDKEATIARLLENANKKCSDLVKLTPDLVLFTRSDKPLVRTLKGTISRRESEELYKDEIDNLYHG